MYWDKKNWIEYLNESKKVNNFEYYQVTYLFIANQWLSL